MGMIWHNVTDDFRVIAEGVYSELIGKAMAHKKVTSFCWCILFLVEFLPVIYYTFREGFLTFPFLL